MKIREAIKKMADVQRTFAMISRAAADAAGAPAKKGVRTFVVQTEAPASDGGIIRTGGADYSYFEPRRTILFGHDDGSGRAVDREGPLSGIPIGTMEARRIVEGLEVPGYDRKVSGTEWDILPAHEAAALENDAGEIAQAIRTVWALIDAGVIRSFSLRFKPLHLEERSEQELIDLGLSPNWGWVADKWRVTEGSILALGADPGAIKRAYASGIDRAQIGRLFPEPQIVVARAEDTTPATPAATPAATPLTVADIAGIRSALEANTRAIENLARINTTLGDVIDELRHELTTEPKANDTAPTDGSVAAPAAAEEPIDDGARVTLARLEEITKNAADLAAQIKGRKK